ncbi:hypothetical protein K501DRAFT_327324 [Backusella circina FSU 941]|nr:hypothetical protein K501DRAFT_327324 [Backusella circina FSU 941]
MEQFSYPEPMPSISTPVQSSGTTTETARGSRRRHTITRPDSAMALLSDMEQDEEDEEDEEAFDRISGILSNLIQEANEAVHGIEQERVQLLKQQKRSKTPSISLSTDSRIPRPRKSRIPQQQQQQQQQLFSRHHHGRHGSTSSITSSTSSISSNSSVCFSPTTSTSSSVITTHSRSPSPKQLFRHTALRPRSCPVIAPPPLLRRRGSHTPKRKIMVQDPLLMASFKRLDTSMAVVDSLSRDLAKQQIRKKQHKMLMESNSSKLTLLLLIPLLHIPHSLITMVFDFCSNPQPPLMIRSSGGGGGSFTVMMFWACLFTVANLMVDNVLPKRRLSLPGAFKSTTTPSKRTWTPLTKTIMEEEKPTLKRRNSI